MGCPCCEQLNEEALRVALRTNTPLRIDRIEQTSPWVQHKASHWSAVFFCDACGQKTVVVIHATEAEDPADWWKKGGKQ
jgi:hypothetical protein